MVRGIGGYYSLPFGTVSCPKPYCKFFSFAPLIVQPQGDFRNKLAFKVFMRSLESLSRYEDIAFYTSFHPDREEVFYFE